MRAAEWPFVGRAAEMRLLEGLGVGSVVVAGGVGLGKSRLVAEALRTASRRGAHTVLLRATRSTASIPFGIFAPWVPADTGVRMAGRIGVMRTIVHDLLEDKAPLLVAVDDAHLLDEASAAVLLHLVVHTRASVLATVRSGERCPDAVVALWKEGLAELVELGPLPESQILELAAGALGGRLDPTAQRRLVALSAGTPLYLREVLRAGVDQGVLTASGHLWGWMGDLAGGGRLRELMDDNLGRAGSDERQVVELVAIGEPLPLDIVRQLGHLDVLATVESLGLVSVETDAERATVRMAHPLYGEVLRADLPALVARRYRAALATAAVEAGLRDWDPLRIASWWLESDSATASPDLYLAAAYRALTLTAWTLAERMARAAETMGAGAEATLARAAALVQLGGWGEAAEPLAALDPDRLDGAQLAQYTRFRAALLMWREGQHEAGRALLSGAARRLTGLARMLVLTDAAYNAILTCSPAEAVRLADRALADAGAAVESRVPATAVAALARVVQGGSAEALHLAQAASPKIFGVVAADPFPGNPAIVMLSAQCMALVLQGRLADSAALVASSLQLIEQNSVENLRAITVGLQGRVALFQGNLAFAQRCGREAFAGTEPGPSSQWPAAVLVTAAAQRGETDLAEEVLIRARATAPAVPLYQHELTLAHAWLLAVSGQPGPARSLLADVASDAAAAGASLLELLALLDLCRLGAAGQVMARLAELRGAIAGPYAAAAAAYAAAAAEGDPERLQEVSTQFEAMEALLLAAEAAASATVAYARAGAGDDERRSRLRARLLVSRCGGARTPTLQAAQGDAVADWLTRREREVLELAARGLSNREIAGRLYISIRTVNSHLHHAYTKLGTSDRRELAAFVSPPARYLLARRRGRSGPSDAL